MAVLRQAEGGSRIVQLYDDLLGRAISTFGQGGK
jgi:flagellar basal-body rod protein FlgG